MIAAPPHRFILEKSVIKNKPGGRRGFGRPGRSGCGMSFCVVSGVGQTASRWRAGRRPSMIRRHTTAVPLWSCSAKSSSARDPRPKYDLKPTVSVGIFPNWLYATAISSDSTTYPSAAMEVTMPTPHAVICRGVGPRGGRGRVRRPTVTAPNVEAEHRAHNNRPDPRSGEC
jgi:hypothetical protein